MRLINARTYKLEEFFSDIPRYAILSHTWEDEEVSFQDFQDLSTASQKRGFKKIRRACGQAIKDKLSYCWVDTCCIDKSSSAELSEAINSMFAWYRKAAICYVYLTDVQILGQFSSSRWFTRGWTLQELLAPRHVVFYSSGWGYLGSKQHKKIMDMLSARTKIESMYLVNKMPLWKASVAKRMSWMSERTTTRVEDLAYCLLGIFEIHMPLLYGEGAQSFVRLQEEIIKQSNDQTIFCWSWRPDRMPKGWSSILAPGPSVFQASEQYYTDINVKDTPVKPYHVTNAGLSISLKIVPTESKWVVLGILKVVGSYDLADFIRTPRRYCLVLQADSDHRIYRRLPFPEDPFKVIDFDVYSEKDIFVRCERRPSENHFPMSPGLEMTSKSDLDAANFGIFLIRSNTAGVSDTLTPIFQTDNMTYYRNESFLRYCFSGMHETTDLGFILFKSSILDMHRLRLCFAVRKFTSVGGIITYDAYCKILLQEGHDLSDFSQRSYESIIRDDDGTKYECRPPYTVLIDNKILYSSVIVSTPLNNIQLAYLTFGGDETTNVLQRHAENPRSSLSSPNQLSMISLYNN